ncbi:MAG: hypothetical protein AB7E80_15885 [Hyphomicrobiaceae bacterium]
MRGHASVRWPICKGQYPISNIVISNGAIFFQSDRFTFRGSVDQRSGFLTIEHSGISPPPSANLNISGYFRNAGMFSGDCGSGFFRIDFWRVGGRRREQEPALLTTPRASPIRRAIQTARCERAAALHMEPAAAGPGGRGVNIRRRVSPAGAFVLWPFECERGRALHPRLEESRCSSP